MAEMTIHVDFNSREMQEWLAQAWEAGFDAAGRWLLYGQPTVDRAPANPFTDEADALE